MSGFQVPSSSTPSTPNPRLHHGSKRNPFASMASNPSTTPAGPPPSTAASFTPAGLPPSSVLGNSTFGGTNSLASLNSWSDSPTSNRFAPAARTKNGTPVGHAFAVPDDSSLLPTGSEEDDERESMAEDQDMEDGYEMEDADAYTDDEGRDDQSEDESMLQDNLAPSPSDLSRSLINSSPSEFSNSFDPNIPRGVKRPRDGGAFGSTFQSSIQSLPGPVSKDSAIPEIVKDLAARLGPAEVYESDDMILTTEEFVTQLYGRRSHLATHDEAVQAALSTVPGELIGLWHSNQAANPSDNGGIDGLRTGIGPDENASPIAKATFMASLLLRLHHPSTSKFDSLRSQSLSFSLSSTSIPAAPQGRQPTVPKILLDWLDTYHNPYPYATVDLQRHRPNSTAHANFWDIIFASILRGKIPEVIRTLREADFKHAETASADGHDGPGYHGIQLGNINRVINRAIQVLEYCPAINVDKDWDIRGNDWKIYRRKISQALSDLATFAEGSDRDRESATKPFEADNFNLFSTQGDSLTISKASRRAESRVPWTIYQNLKVMYGMLSGHTAELLSVSQDWVEATVGLTVWWDGEDDTNFLAGRHSLSRSQSRNVRPVDIDPTAAYLQRLSDSLCEVTQGSHESDLQLDPLNPVEVGLASVFEGNVEGVVGLLRSWSLTITSAVVEIASIGGWLPLSGGNDLMKGFDESDLMVLSYNRLEEKTLNRDSLLLEYAEAVFNREELQSSQLKETRKGWEIAVQILGRLDDAEKSSSKIGELLDTLQLDSSELVDKLLRICNTLGLADQACRISEKYADSVAEQSYNYGMALLYYARAHNAKKVKDVLDLLVSLCLVQSIAYPPESEVDDQLKQFIYSPKQTLENLSYIDSEAADLLSSHMSGYATLRRFYCLRDEDVNLNTGEQSGLRPIARKKAAASALIAVIESAEDNIHGGLYDKNRGTIIQVDGLLALLGEAMVFVNQPNPILTVQQTFLLLKAIEDLQTAPSRIYEICTDCFTSTLASYHGTQSPGSPRAMLKKSLSSMTGSSRFSLIESEMFASRESSFKGGKGRGRGGERSIGSSGVLVAGVGNEVKRGWDWRKGIGRDGKPEDVLRILRLGLARELARGWIEC